MKKLYFLKSILLLCCLVVGSSAWATDANFSYTDFSGQGTSGSGGNLTGATKGDITITGKGNGNTNYLQVYANNYLTITPASGATITSIVITATNSGYIKTWTASDASSVAISDNTATWSGSSTSAITLTNSATAQARITAIKVTYTSAGGGSSVDQPTFSPASGAVAAGTTVSITQAEADAIRYTTDGTDPTKTTGTVYSTPITITTATTIKAIAIKGDDVSDVATAAYTINVTGPSFSPYTGTYAIGTTITLTSAGNTIYYTTNGDTPTKSSTEYTTPIVLNESMVVKAIAVDGYGNSSSVRTATYTAILPGQVDITPSYTFFGKASSFSGTTYDEVSGTTTEGIAVTFTRNGANLYASGSAMRVYPKNTIKIDAPEGTVITKVFFTQSNATADDLTSSAGEYTSATHTWNGSTSSVTFTRPSGGSSYLQFTKISVVLAGSVSISDAGLATFACDVALDFSGATGVEAYIAKESAGAITLTKVTKVPANTGVLLRSTSGSAVAKDVPVAATTDDVTGNIFVRGTDAAVATGTGPYNWILSKKSGVVGFYHANGNTVAKNRAYLQTSTASARINLNFDDEDATAIEAVKTQNVENGQFFNLAGQRVAQPTKGLYIVNGKKVVIK